MTEQVAGLLGSTAIVPKDDRYLHNQRIGLITCDEGKITKMFAYYLFMTKSVRNQLELTSSGTKVKHTSPERIYDVEVEIPGLDDQKKIADLLWTIDERIRVNNEINDNLQQQLKLLFEYTFSDKSRHGVLSDIACITMGQSPTGSSYNEIGDGVPFYQGSTDFGDIFPTVRVFTTKPSRMASLADTLLSVRAPVGTINIAYEKCCIGRGLAAIRGKNNNNAFVRYLLKHNTWYFDNINNSGTTFGSITKDYLYEMPVFIPDNKSLAFFEVRANTYEQQIFTLEREIRQLSQLRDWLLPMLMNGQAHIGD